MNVTRKFEKKLEAMTNTEIEQLKAILATKFAQEKNPLIKSSLNSRIRLCDKELAGVSSLCR